MSRTFNELSQVVITASPLDSDGAESTPTTARYRVDDCRTETSLVGWTDLTPSTAMTITIPGSANGIQDNTLNTPEEKVVTVELDDGLTTQHYAQYTYRIKNLPFATASG